MKKLTEIYYFLTKYYGFNFQSEYKKITQMFDKYMYNQN